MYLIHIVSCCAITFGEYFAFLSSELDEFYPEAGLNTNESLSFFLVFSVLLVTKSVTLAVLVIPASSASLN